MILPDTNPTIAQVRQALDYPSTSLGTLSQCPNINPYSMWKPIRSLTSSMNYNYLKATNFGFADATSDEDDISIRRYEYQPPYDGLIMRLGDFRNYNNDREATRFCNTSLPDTLQPQSLNLINTSFRWDETSTLLGMKSIYDDCEYWGLRIKSLTNPDLKYYCTFKRPNGDIPVFLSDDVFDWYSIGLNIEVTQYIAPRIFGDTFFSGQWQTSNNPLPIYPVLNLEGQVITKNYTLASYPAIPDNTIYASTLTADPTYITSTAGGGGRYTFQLRDRANLGFSRLKSLTSRWVINREASTSIVDYPNSATTSGSVVYITEAGTNLYNYTFIIPPESAGKRIYLTIYLTTANPNVIDRLQRFIITYT
ncbi:hypothetical protein LJC54_00130 [Parabacteroides sp. OttesenSCG-928-J18]|nr:hypothetical protein [Parabacteroides sp. OttesenSCG-928-J18]